MRARALDVTRADWAAALDASAYSLIALARGLAPHMAAAPAAPAAAAAAGAPPPPPPRSASLTALSYLGAERVVRGYRVMGVAKAALESSARYLAEDMGAMGVRVNVISAGPIDTLAARTPNQGGWAR
jgi:enoyl-[acyl-carrier protein] reductase I